MLKISILMVYLLSQDKGISGLSKFSLYKQKTDLKKNPSTKTPLEYTGPPILNVNWNGHPNLPEEVNNAEILKEIMQKVAEYKRYEYCPFSKKVDDCQSMSVNEVVDRIIDVVLHPTEPPTEPSTPALANIEPHHDENNEEEKDNVETEGAPGTEENEGTDEEVDTAGTTEEGQKSSTVEAAAENSEEEPSEAPTK